MMKVESVTIRTAKNGFTVEPSYPFEMGTLPPDASGDMAAMRQRREDSRPQVATSVEDALTMAAEMLGVPCDVVPSVDEQTGVDEPDSAMTDDPSEMF